jgi:hypothetical protein
MLQFGLVQIQKQAFNIIFNKDSFLNTKIKIKSRGDARVTSGKWHLTEGVQFSILNKSRLKQKERQKHDSPLFLKRKVYLCKKNYDRFPNTTYGKKHSNYTRQKLFQ